MSGLAAVFQRDGASAESGPVREMLGSMPYRGPDGSFVASFGPLVLGHARMAITLEDARAGQPLVSRRTGCAIVGDAARAGV